MHSAIFPAAAFLSISIMQTDLFSTKILPIHHPLNMQLHYMIELRKGADHQGWNEDQNSKRRKSAASFFSICFLSFEVLATKNRLDNFLINLPSFELINNCTATIFQASKIMWGNYVNSWRNACKATKKHSTIKACCNFPGLVHYHGRECNSQQRKWNLQPTCPGCT